MFGPLPCVVVLGGIEALWSDKFVSVVITVLPKNRNYRNYSFRRYHIWGRGERGAVSRCASDLIFGFCSFCHLSHEYRCFTLSYGTGAPPRPAHPCPLWATEAGRSRAWVQAFLGGSSRQVREAVAGRERVTRVIILLLLPPSSPTSFPIYNSPPPPTHTHHPPAKELSGLTLCGAFQEPLFLCSKKTSAVPLQTFPSQGRASPFALPTLLMFSPVCSALMHTACITSGLYSTTTVPVRYRHRACPRSTLEQPAYLLLSRPQFAGGDVVVLDMHEASSPPYHVH